MQAAAGGTAAVTVREPIAGGPSTRFRTMALDSATGRVRVASLAPEESGGAPGPVFGCVDDGRTLIACADHGGRLVTVRPDGRPFAARKALFEGATSVEADLVWRDRVLASRALDANRRAGAVADRAANGLGAGTPPGRAAVMSDRFGAFLVPRGLRQGIAMYGASDTGRPDEPDLAGPTRRPPRVEARPLWTAKAGTLPGAAHARRSEGLHSIANAVLDGDAAGVGEHAVRIETRDGATRITGLPRTAGLTAFRAFGPWVAATRPAPPGGGSARFPLLDAAGRALPGGLPGAPVALGGGVAVLATPGRDGAAALSVHRVQG